MAEQSAVLNQLVLDFLDSISAAIDADAAPGYVEFWQGTIPATIGDATAGTLLVTVILDDPSFAAAVDTTPGGSMTMNPTPGGVNAIADGQIDYYRAFDGAGNPVIQGNAGTADAACIVSSPNTTTGFPLDILSWVITLAETNY